MPTIKILLIAHDSRIHGGANRSLLSIIEQLKSSGRYEVYVLLPGIGKMNTVIEEKGIQCICYPYHCIVTKRKNGFSGFFRIIKMQFNFITDYFSSAKLAAKLKPLNLDMIYTNTRIVFIGGFVARKLDIPHMMHCRELIKDNMLRTAFGAEKIIDKFSNKVIVISDIMKKSFKNLDQNKLTLIYNGLPSPDNKGVRTFVNKDFYNILVTGTIIPAKGQLDAIQALYVLKIWGIQNIFLHIVGSDPDLGKSDSYKRVLEEKVRELNLVGSVVFHGEVQDMETVRKDMDIELICSIFEPFGRVTVEAMQNNLVAIGADAGATPEIIKNEYNGLLYKLHNYEDLAQKIKTIIDNPVLANKLIKNANEFLKTNFTLDKTVHEISKLIINTLAL